MRKKTGDRRQSILDTAAIVFLELGYGRTSMDVIAKRWGGSKTTIYGYFASKEALFVAVVGEFVHNYVDVFSDILDPAADLRQTLQTFGEHWVTMSGLKEVLGGQRHAMGDAARYRLGNLYYERGPLEALKIVAHFLERCMDAGTLVRTNSLIAAQHLIGLLRAENFEVLVLGVKEGFTKKEIAGMVERAITVFLRGYGVA